MALIRARHASSSNSTPPWNYHVFLSFRGEDTRKNFTDHLYTALHQRGIVTFKDDRELERGQVIYEGLFKAIKESLFAIVIFSQNYAYSPWCLDELLEIVESKQHLRGTVFAVFYRIKPSDVRYQKGNIGAALEKHQDSSRFTQDKVQRWREALTKVANLSGDDTTDRHEAGIIEDIVETIWTKLHVDLPSKFDYLVGIQSRVNKLIPLLEMQLDRTSFVGIWGMGGIGKTTLARVVFNAIRRKFEAGCFLANVRGDSERKGIVYLQKKLLSCLLQKNIETNYFYEVEEATMRHFLCNKKVLVVLDDVSNISQLKNLAGDKDWFGHGSKIIITTRDIHLMTKYDQFATYQVETLNSDESLKLLCREVFKKDGPEEGYMDLSFKVAEYAGGLPLALEVLGSHLHKRSQSEWRGVLNKMKKPNLHQHILKSLRISYDGLEYEELKALFLDIACFFNYEEKVKVTKILENCSFDVEHGINLLIEKSLLYCCKPYVFQESWGGGKEFLYMHDLLQEMGRSIVIQESPNDVGRRSRLWSQDEIDLVLKGNKGTREVQKIYMKLHESYETNWHSDCFSTMCNLRLLYASNVHLSHSLHSLPGALKVLVWDGYSLEALPNNIDQLYELVDLQLRHSKIKYLWSGTLFSGQLKFIDLSNSEVLTEMPDFSGIPNLESLVLKGCISLVRVHKSLGMLKKLVKLNMKDCKNLVNLPSKLEMDSLEEFILSGCSKLEKLPEFGENMKSLFICDFSKTNVKKVPSSIIHLTNLKALFLQGCKGLVSLSWRSSLFWLSCFMRPPIPMGLRLPNPFSGLSLLKKLDLSYCNMCDGSIPDDLSGLSSLMSLDLRGNNFATLPAACISNLVNLERFYLTNCPRLKSLPKLPPNLINVDASCCPSIEPILDAQNLFASLVSKHRDLILYEDIVLTIPGYEIPTWFEQREYFANSPHAAISITTDIPYVRDKREWSGIAVCLMIKRRVPSPTPTDTFILWGFEADLNKNVYDTTLRTGSRVTSSYGTQLYIAFFPFNGMNCWRHLRGESRRLKLTIRTIQCGFMPIADCGWRLICKKDFDTCNNTTAASGSHNKKMKIQQIDF